MGRLCHRRKDLSFPVFSGGFRHHVPTHSTPTATPVTHVHSHPHSPTCSTIQRLDPLLPPPPRPLPSHSHIRSNASVLFQNCCQRAFSRLSLARSLPLHLCSSLPRMSVAPSTSGWQDVPEHRRPRVPNRDQERPLRQRGVLPRGVRAVRWRSLRQAPGWRRCMLRSRHQPLAGLLQRRVSELCGLPALHVGDKRPWVTAPHADSSPIRLS